MEAAQNHLETWAVVELMGHQKEVGFVTTQYYGAACMFKIDVPELPEKEFALERTDWVGGRYFDAGTLVRYDAKPGTSSLVSFQAIYRITPCDQESAMAVLEEMARRDLKLAEVSEMPVGVDEMPF